MPPPIFGARPCAAASDGAWELLMDVDESRVNDQDLTILTLDQKQYFDRLQLASLRELGSRLGMPRLALKALEACGQVERYLFIDGQPTSMLIRCGDLRGVPLGCALSVHSCNLAGWAWNVCVNRELPHVRTNAYLDDRLVSADSCDPLPRTLVITKQVDDYFGAVLNSSKSSWTSTKLPSHRRRKLCELIDYTRSLVYLGVDVPLRGTPWRMKQRVRAVGVRSELIRVLPPSQRGILVADAVVSLWIAGGTSFGVRQLKPMSSKLAGALRVSVAKRYGTRARVAEHLFGPGVHKTFPPAAYIYTFCLQFTRMVSMGRLDVPRFANLWTHRAQCLGCVHGMVEAYRAIAVDWCAPCGGATFNFSPVASHHSVPFEVGEFIHATSQRASWMSNLRYFPRLTVSRFLALVRRRDCGSLTGGMVDDPVWRHAL